MNGHMNTQESEPWVELANRLKDGRLIVAADPAEINREYLIMPGPGLFQTERRASTELDTSTPLPQSSSSTAGPVKKTNETIHLLVNEKKGQGGFGVVYRVTKSHPKGGVSREICLKQARLNSWLSLVHENEMFSILEDHPHEHIIRRDFMCHSKHDNFLGIDYFDGYTLSDIISVNKMMNKRMAHKDLVIILEQQVDAIEHLQKNGIYHCDIKPDNIIYHRGRELSKLIDFGLAVHRFGPGETFKSQGGTTEYMAPETLLDSELDTGSDLYGLAATMHHLITLRAPWFSVENVQQIRDQKFEGDSAGYAEFSRMRRAKIKQAIKHEITRYRGEAAEAVGNNLDEPHLAIQMELWNHKGPCVEPLKQILCLMLHHTSSERLACADITFRLQKYLNRDVHIQKQLSQFSLSSNNSNHELARVGNPISLDYTDIAKSDESNIAVVPSIHSQGDMLPTFEALMDNSSAHQPALSQLLGQSSRSQQPSDMNMAVSTGNIGYPSHEMPSFKASQPAAQYPDDEYHDNLPRVLDMNSFCDSGGYLDQVNLQVYDPDPNQPSGKHDPTGMTDYVLEQLERSAPPSERVPVEDVMPDGDSSLDHNTDDDFCIVRPAGIGSYNPTSPENPDIQNAPKQVEEDDELDL